jgi:LPS export ABC transporter protein LptC
VRNLLLIPLLLLISCELDYGLTDDGMDAPRSPDVIMTDIYQVEVQGSQVIHLQAENAEIYYEDGETSFTKVQFREFDENLKVIRRGKAGLVLQYENQDILLKDDIEVEDIEEESTITADELMWVDADRTLNAPEDGWVRISWDGNSSMQGWGFSADFSTLEIQFTGSLTGVLKDNP